MVEGTSPESRADSNESNAHEFPMITLCYGEIVDSPTFVSARKLLLFFSSSGGMVTDLGRIVSAERSPSERVISQTSDVERSVSQRSTRE